MIDTDLSWIEQKLRQRRVLYGAFAVLISLFFHGLLVSNFPELRFGALVNAVRERVLPPLRVQKVDWESVSRVSRPERFRPENPNLTVDMPGEAGSLRKGLDEVSIEPPVVREEVLAGESKALGQPTETPQRTQWDPRREILMVEKKVFSDTVNFKPKGFEKDPFLRTKRAPDIAFPLERPDSLKVPRGGREDFYRLGSPSGTVDSVVLFGGDRAGRARRPGTNAVDLGQDVSLTPERPELVTGAIPIERFLVADVRTYRSLRDLKYAYCRIEIKRRGPEFLPVLPKDIAFVQDCSASMTEQRIHFCREGLSRALAHVGPDDRFNVFGFRDKAEKCFPEWVKLSTATLEQARKFIGEMKSEGNTDIYASIGELLRLERVPGRPIIAVIASDGIPTVGMTVSSRIITEFSRDNEGAISVFTLGTAQTANAYLLDLLSYCDRGDSFIITRGRWEIPDIIEARVKEVTRPVLTDIRFRFQKGAILEAYPMLTSNLYLDRSLVLYCRYPRGQKRFALQAVGAAGAKVCDMVFDLDMDSAPEGGAEIREKWAWQKLYHLMREHARTKDARLAEEASRTAKGYGIEVPYDLSRR